MIVTPSSDLTFVQDETLSLNVYVTGVPQPDITWRKDNNNINFNDPRVTLNGTNLTVSDAQYTDAGVYIIRAENIADTTEMSYRVFIKCKV